MSEGQAVTCDHDSQFIEDFGGHWRCLRCGEHTCVDPCVVTEHAWRGRER